MQIDQDLPEISEYLYQKAVTYKIPLAGTFELTARCNMNCRMCYVWLSKEQVKKLGGERTAEDWIKLAEKCRDAGMLYLLLTGGEPFLYKDFEALYKELNQMGFIISINTNATMIDEKRADWLAENPPNRMNITLYGASDKTYQDLCNNPKGYTQVTKAIALLKERGITLKLNCSLTPYNVHDLEQMIDYARKEKIYIQTSSYMFPPVRKSEEYAGRGNRFTAKEAAFYTYEIERLRLGETDYKKKMEGLQKSIELAEKEYVPECGEAGKMECRAGKCTFWVNWKGEMLPCGMMNWPLVDLKQVDFLHAWEQIYNMTDAISMPKACSSCKQKPFCTLCAASSYAETGTFGEKPVYYCQMTEELIRLAKNIKGEEL